MFGTLIGVGIFFPNKITAYKVAAPHVLNPLESLTDTPDEASIKEAINFISDNMGLKRTEMYQTLVCESNLKYNAVGDSGLAYGVAQFHKGTFDSFCKGDYYSTKDQLICMANMWKENLQFHWSCWKNYFAS